MPGELVLDGLQVRAGDSLGVSAGGFVAGETVLFTIGDVELGGAAADAEGVVRADLVVPTDFEPGPYELVATGAEQVLTAQFEVLAASGTDPTRPGEDGTDGVPGGEGPGGLPDTGASVGAAAVVVLALLAAGAVLVTRRRLAEVCG